MNQMHRYIFLIACCTLGIACTKKYGALSTTQGYVTVDHSELSIPPDTEVSYKNTVLKMDNDTRWHEINDFFLPNINDPVTIQSGFYSNISLSTEIHFRKNDRDTIIYQSEYMDTPGNGLNVYGKEVTLHFKLKPNK